MMKIQVTDTDGVGVGESKMGVPVLMEATGHRCKGVKIGVTVLMKDTGH